MELKKVLLYAGIPILIIFGPLIAISTPAVGCYQSQIDKNPNTDSSKNWQIRLADLCMKSFRTELAAEMYGKFVDRYPDDPRRPDILWAQAEAYESSENVVAHRETLVKLCVWYPDHPRAKEADEHLRLSHQYFIRTINEPANP